MTSTWGSQDVTRKPEGRWEVLEASAARVRPLREGIRASDSGRGHLPLLRRQLPLGLLCLVCLRGGHFWRRARSERRSADLGPHPLPRSAPCGPRDARCPAPGSWRFAGRGPAAPTSPHRATPAAPGCGGRDGAPLPLPRRVTGRAGRGGAKVRPQVSSGGRRRARRGHIRRSRRRGSPARRPGSRGPGSPVPARRRP